MPTKSRAQKPGKRARKAPAKKANGKTEAKPPQDIFEERPTDFQPPAHPAAKKVSGKRTRKQKVEAKPAEPPPAPAPEPEPDLRWKDLLPEMSGRWIHTKDGWHAGGPAKRALCPDCRFFLASERRGQGLCSSAVGERTRQDPAFTCCYHASKK